MKGDAPHPAGTATKRRSLALAATKTPAVLKAILKRPVAEGTEQQEKI
jgi:hypothetical protein